MVGGPVYASPRRVGDSYLVGADDGVLYRISDEGELAGQFETDGLIRAPVALSGTRQWRKAVLKLPHAHFGGRQNLGADLRISGRVLVRRCLRL